MEISSTIKRISPESLLRQQEITAPLFGDSVLATLGPKGTSAEAAAGLLADLVGTKTRLFESFDEVLGAITSGSVDLALVPSAYNGLTQFHWHADLEMVGFFPLATPDYGIAAPSGYVRTNDRRVVRVASMWEVRRIYHDVMPDFLTGRPIEWVDADSTQAAAKIVVAGGADVAVTNANGLKQQNLTWLAVRAGAEIIWTIFARRH